MSRGLGQWEAPIVIDAYGVGGAPNERVLRCLGGVLFHTSLILHLVETSVLYHHHHGPLILYFLGPVPWVLYVRRLVVY